MLHPDNSVIIIKVSELRNKLKDYESGSLAVVCPPAQFSPNQTEIDR
jgi:hypothetical protein